VLPMYDAKAKDWPKRCASAAIASVFGRVQDRIGSSDHSFCYSNKTYEVCVETMTLSPSSKANVIVPISRLKPSKPENKRLVIAVFANKTPRGLDCEVKGWANSEEVRKWEAPGDKQMFKRKGKRFAMMPPERLSDIESLKRMSEDWRCDI